MITCRIKLKILECWETNFQAHGINTNMTIQHTIKKSANKIKRSSKARYTAKLRGWAIGRGNLEGHVFIGKEVSAETQIPLLHA